MITNSFMVGVDFNDVRAILSDDQPSSAQISLASASGAKRALEATQEALAALTRLKPNSNILVAIFAGPDLELKEFSNVCELIEEKTRYGTGLYVAGCILEHDTPSSEELSILIIERLANSLNNTKSAATRKAQSTLETSPAVADDIPEFLRRQSKL